MDNDNTVTILKCHINKPSILPSIIPEEEKGDSQDTLRMPIIGQINESIGRISPGRYMERLHATESNNNE